MMKLISLHIIFQIFVSIEEARAFVVVNNLKNSNTASAFDTTKQIQRQEMQLEAQKSSVDSLDMKVSHGLHSMCKIADRVNLPDLDVRHESLVSQFPSLISADLSDPCQFAAGLLNDLSCVTLDFTAIFGPNGTLLNLMVVIGHIVQILSDYIPDHYMQPDELIFQLATLYMASGRLLKSAAPSLMSNIVKRDRLLQSCQYNKTFSTFFEPVGVTWSQFQALKVNTLEWVTVKPGEEIKNSLLDSSNDEYIYWLCSGKIEVQRNRCATSNKKENLSKGLIGDAKMIWHTENYLQGTGAISRSKSAEAKDLADVMIHAGKEGANLLKINLKCLKEETKHNQKLAQSIRLLFMKEMLDKQEALMKVYKSQNN